MVSCMTPIRKGCPTAGSSHGGMSVPTIRPKATPQCLALKVCRKRKKRCAPLCRGVRRETDHLARVVDRLGVGEDLGERVQHVDLLLLVHGLGETLEDA